MALTGEGMRAGAAADGVVPRWRRFRWRLILWPLLAALVPLLGAFVGLAFILPIGEEAPGPRPSLVLEDAAGRVFATRGAFRGMDVASAELPAHLIEAVIAIEDRRFRRHHGLDLRGIARAALANLMAGATREGGSTITQQLVRLSYLTRERSWGRKVQEAMLALWLDARLSKDEILERYLNRAYFGAGAFGVEGAAQRYFGKPAKDLTLSEAAMLAGLIQAPSVLAPTRDLAAARARAETVLQAMVETGALGKAEAAAARAAPATLAMDPEAAPGRGYFADWVAEEAGRLLGPVAALYRVRTTLDPTLQEVAEQVVGRWLTAEGERQGVSQAALVALSHDGAVLAMVGGRDYAASQFNRATQARRQPGSLFKLFVYMAALNHGWTPDSIVVDAPVQIGDWRPANYDDRYHGEVTLRTAFALSLNSVAVRLAEQVGPAQVAALARALGIISPLAETPSLALGTSPVTLLEITRAYAAVAAGRAAVQSHGIEALAGGGHVLRLRPLLQTSDTALPWKQREILDLLLAAVRSGTARAAALDRPAAGKTGTTQDYRDAWYVGFTADAVVGVWVGNDDNRPMRQVTGGDLPALIWRDFMRAADAAKAAPPESAATGGVADSRAAGRVRAVP